MGYFAGKLFFLKKEIAVQECKNNKARTRRESGSGNHASPAKLHSQNPASNERQKPDPITKNSPPIPINKATPARKSLRSPSKREKQATRPATITRARQQRPTKRQNPRATPKATPTPYLLQAKTTPLLHARTTFFTRFAKTQPKFAKFARFTKKRVIMRVAFLKCRVI